MENKYLIIVEETDVFESRVYQHCVIASTDTHDPNMLTYSGMYGNDGFAQLSNHPEAVLIQNCNDFTTATLKEITCDILKAPADYITHQVNCRGVMGAGLAKQIKIFNPKLYDIYQSHCRNYKPTDLLGKSFIYHNIISIFGQLNYGRDKSVVYTDYTALARAFQAIHKRLPIDKSIAFPYFMGCGLGNGQWDIVEDLIRYCFPGRTVYICVKDYEADAKVIDTGFDFSQRPYADVKSTYTVEFDRPVSKEFAELHFATRTYLPKSNGCYFDEYYTIDKLTSKVATERTGMSTSWRCVITKPFCD